MCLPFLDHELNNKNGDKRLGCTELYCTLGHVLLLMWNNTQTCDSQEQNAAFMFAYRVSSKLHVEQVIDSNRSVNSRS